MKRINQALIVGLLYLVFLLPNTYAHSNVLVDISLDFDQRMKEQVVKRAAEFSGIREKPMRFDYMFENVAVIYNRTLEYSVQINPSTMQVFGFRDDSLAKDAKGAEKFNEKQRKEIAQKVFDSIPKNYQEELRYFGEKRGYTGAYRLVWFRLVDDILVSNEMFEVEVNPISGKVVSWRLTPFLYPKEDFITNPGFSHTIAEQIALQFFDTAQLIEGETPRLIYEDQKPVWVVKVKALYPFYAVIDAMNGRMKYSGIPKAEMPTGYAAGIERMVIQSEDVRKAII